MYKKILVLLDGSARAEAIMPHVEDLASCYGATVILMQVVEPTMAYTSPYDAYLELHVDEAERRHEEVSEYLARWEEKLQDRGIKTRRRVGFGPVVQAILDSAVSEGADLIAMASHGSGSRLLR